MNVKASKKLFEALADETRLRILNLLSEGELCVCDLICVLGEPQSKVSRHLAYLRKAGLVEARRDGLWMHYRLSKPAAKMHEAILKTVCSCRAECGEFEKDLKALAKNKGRLVGCCK